MQSLLIHQRYCQKFTYHLGIQIILCISIPQAVRIVYQLPHQKLEPTGSTTTTFIITTIEGTIMGVTIDQICLLMS